MLVALHQPTNVSSASAHFTQVQLSGVPFFWLADALQTVCDGLQRTDIGFYGQAIGAAAQVGLSFLAVHPRGLDRGFLGTAAARSASGVITFLSMITMVQVSRLGDRVWRHSTGQRVLHRAGIWEYLQIALPGAFVMWCEWWAFEGITLLVGLLPASEITLGAHGTMFNLLVTFFMAFTGLGAATCALAGKRIGEGAGDTVPRLFVIASTLALSMSVLVGGTLYVLRKQLAEAFTSDQAVIALVESSMIGASATVPGYAIFMTTYGVLHLIVPHTVVG